MSQDRVYFELFGRRATGLKYSSFVMNDESEAKILDMMMDSSILIKEDDIQYEEFKDGITDNSLTDRERALIQNVVESMDLSDRYIQVKDHPYYEKVNSLPKNPHNYQTMEQYQKYFELIKKETESRWNYLNFKDAIPKDIAKMDVAFAVDIPQMHDLICLEYDECSDYLPASETIDDMCRTTFINTLVLECLQISFKMSPDFVCNILDVLGAFYPYGSWQFKMFCYRTICFHYRFTAHTKAYAFLLGDMRQGRHLLKNLETIKLIVRYLRISVCLSLLEGVLPNGLGQSKLSCLKKDSNGFKFENLSIMDKVLLLADTTGTFVGGYQIGMALQESVLGIDLRKSNVSKSAIAMFETYMDIAYGLKEFKDL